MRYFFRHDSTQPAYNDFWILDFQDAFITLSSCTRAPDELDYLQDHYRPIDCNTMCFLRALRIATEIFASLPVDVECS